MEIRKISHRRPSLVDVAELSHITDGVVLQRTTKKCTKIYNARAQSLFCYLNLLFGDVLVTVVVMVCLTSQYLRLGGAFYSFSYQEQEAKVTSCELV